MSPRTVPAAASAGTVSALERGIAVLHCFDENVASLSNAELSQRTAIPKPTVTRLAATLVGLGLLRQDPATERFSLAAGVVSLARAFLAHIDVREVARPYMAELARELGGSSYLAVRDGFDMVLIEIARSREAALRSHHEIGTRIPLATSALGRAYLSGLAQSHPQRHRQLMVDLQKHHGDSAWPPLAAKLQQARQTLAEHGYTLSLGDVSPEIHSVAVPLPTADGEPMALNFGGLSYTCTEVYLRRTVAPALGAAVQAVARGTGAA
ncbi:MAG: IclR family transcriptional regulator [Pigmentiphaga sp.]